MKAVASLFFILLHGMAAAVADDTSLPEGVQRALDIRGVPADSLSVFVADLDSGETVLRWNRSTFFAISVGQLADALVGLPVRDGCGD